MKNKRILLLIALLILTASAIGFFLIERGIQNSVSNESTGAKSQKIVSNSSEQIDSDKNAVKADFYKDSVYNLNFVTIYEIANLPAEMKRKVDKIFEDSQGCYFLIQNPETKKIYILLQSPIENTEGRYSRHTLQMAEIDTVTGNVSYVDFGFNGQDDEINNAVVQQKGEEWVFDESEEPYRPLKHAVYDKKKKILYSEMWNYDETEPVKYEMTNEKGNVISVRKEVFDNNSGYREEHILYDDDGNIVRSMTADYDGANLKWFTYYDSNMPRNNITIESEYENGIKIAENIYNQEYQLVKKLTASYNNGDFVSLKIFGKDGSETGYLIHQ